MSKTKKKPHAEVVPIADHIALVLTPFCQRIEIAGSLRRGRPMVGDIEIVAIPHRPLKPQPTLFDPPEIDWKRETELGEFLFTSGVKFRVNGLKYKSFYYRSFQVDLFLPTVENWGWRFVLSTGSAEFNKWLVTSKAAGGAMPTDMNSSGGYLQRQGEKIVTAEEVSVFEAMGLPFIPVEYRDDERWLSMA